MTDRQPQPGQRLFRPEAIEHYLEQKDAAVLPRFVMPRTLVFVWCVLALLLAGGYFAWSTRIPVFASGTAIIVKSSNQSGLRVVALFLASVLPRLHVGQKLLLTLDAAGKSLSLPVTKVLPNILSPAAVVSRYGKAALVRQPTSVVLAPFTLPADGLSATAYVGGVYRAEVQTGSQRALSLLPVVGQWFKD